MRCRWFPATHTHPRTTFMFQFLEQFHIMNLSGKINLYDYYKAIEKLTDNTGGKIPNRYPSSLRVRSIEETKPAELAVKCIACPDPDVNLPTNWTEAPAEMKFLYILFLAFDACFRLKRKRVSTWSRDPSLQDGWAYFVENKPYLALV
ncbi:hypothetical protein K435DRAFT_858427 [Dendrothele bispora CBS 962.96]|uniref:CxC2-like cysteine cluster KDZ transposase-associated domain-containing protein n=1 Tax=Dendrothele bispora (strain CBS 962.96) TaxID=1314807 RepID=A0A4S8M4B7_DENBC|nr:hypothetical protein K435DRAFT_858427 [Dendrothele bispora CBS 962.96]